MRDNFVLCDLLDCNSQLAIWNLVTVKLPRFTSGSIGKLDYKALNQAFTAIENLEARKNGDRVQFGGVQHDSFVAMITGLMTDSVQGAAQTTGQGTLVKAYLYNWSEIKISYGAAGIGSGVGVEDQKGARGIGFTDSIAPPNSYYPAVDFTQEQRFSQGDLVVLTRISIYAGSKYSAMYSAQPLGNLTDGFLARLTVKHASIEGIYHWSGVGNATTGSTIGKTAAINLYELNAIRDCENYANVLTVGTLTFSGSNDWGHGQVVTAVTKLALPVGGAGTGTLVRMYKGPISATSTTVTAGAFIVGQAYKILTVGTTNYTLIGASASTVDVVFVATGVGSGTGTATFNGQHYYFYSVAPVTCA